LLDIEVANALRRLERRRAVTAQRAEQALSDFAALRVRRYPHGRLMPRIWQLRLYITTADAAYIALAEALDAPLITSDGALGRASGHSATIELFG
jgi:predicted nucleic acid-binding protein